MNSLASHRLVTFHRSLFVLAITSLFKQKQSFFFKGKKDVSIVGIIDRITDPQTIRTKKGRSVEKQDITLLQRDRSVIVSCWGEKCSVLKGISKESNSQSTIIHITDLTVTIFAGKIRCNTTFNSILTVNPVGFTLEMLLPENVQKIQQVRIQPSSFTTDGPPDIPSATSVQLTTLSGIQDHLAPLVTNHPVGGAVIALLKDIDLDRPFYIRCPKCKKALPAIDFDLHPEQSIFPDIGQCPCCKVDAELQYKIKTVFIDGTASLTVNLFGDVSATLLGYTANQLFLFDSTQRYEVRRKLFWKRFYIEFVLYSRDSRSLTVSVKSLSVAPTTLTL